MVGDTDHMIFTVTRAVDPELIERPGVDLLSYEKSRIGHQLGKLIVEKKGVKIEPDPELPLILLSARFFVFTASELEHFVKNLPPERLNH